MTHRKVNTVICINGENNYITHRKNTHTHTQIQRGEQKHTCATNKHTNIQYTAIRRAKFVDIEEYDEASFNLLTDFKSIPD